MEEKNKKLAEKNTKLKEELDKLQVFQKRLLKENINTRFFSNVMHQKMINMLETNLENIENALSNTIKMKNEICPKTKQNKISKINFKNIENEYIENEERIKAENTEQSHNKEEEFLENNLKINENEKEKINLENKEFFSEFNLKRKEKTNKIITKKRKKKRLLNMKRK